MDLREETRDFSVKNFLIDNLIYILLAVMVILMGIINPKFFSFTVLRDIVTQNSSKIIMACGMGLCLLLGAFDLSAGRIVGLSAVLTASLCQKITYSSRFYPEMGDISILFGIALSLVIGLLVGFLNGLIITKLRVPPIIATLGMSIVVYGACSLYFDMPPNNSQSIGGLKSELTFLGSGRIGGVVPTVLIIAIIVVLLMWFILNHTSYGRSIYAVGGNIDAARVSGINVDLVKISVFTIAAFLFSLTGVLEAARTASATSNYGLNYELDAIASCVIGGVSNSGGVGRVSGIVAGVLMFGIINYGLTFLGVNPYYQQILKGIIIIGAVALDISKQKGKP